MADAGESPNIRRPTSGLEVKTRRQKPLYGFFPNILCKILDDDNAANAEEKDRFQGIHEEIHVLQMSSQSQACPGIGFFPTADSSLELHKMKMRSLTLPQGICNLLTWMRLLAAQLFKAVKINE